ncbi:hypothetical protein V8B97DRAFT_2003970 [Scleroderma yunnanense]
MLPRRCSRLVRTLHVSQKCQNLVGPNDPVSNLRPIIYTDTPNSPPKTQSEVGLNHPYSLREFSNEPPSPNHALELQYKLKREQLDTLNHSYWAESNTRFEAAKASVLSSIPDSASSETREHALSEFFKKWVVQEQDRQELYSREWRKRNFEVIVLGARIEYRRFKQRILG